MEETFKKALTNCLIKLAGICVDSGSYDCDISIETCRGILNCHIEFSAEENIN